MQQAPAFVRKEGQDHFAGENQIFLVHGDETENIKARQQQSLFKRNLSNLLLYVFKTLVFIRNQLSHTFYTLLFVSPGEQSEKHFLAARAFEAHFTLTISLMDDKRVD